MSAQPPEDANPADDVALARSPLVEVVCGLVYDPLPLDGMLLGIYWDERKEDFPKRGLVPPLIDGLKVVLEPARARAVLESADGASLVQLQHDRFFFNWRARDEGAYPGFSDAAAPGVLQRSLAEFQRFGDFCEARLAARPQVKRAELTKVDVLNRGADWADIDDLAALVPITGTFAAWGDRTRREIALRFVEHHDEETVIVAINSLLSHPGGETVGLQIETRVLCPATDLAGAEGRLRAASRSANGVFTRLVADLARFGRRSQVAR